MKDKTSKFTREYYGPNEDGNRTRPVSRWHYDLEVTKNGPVLVEDLDYSREKKIEKKQKKPKKNE